MIYFKAQRGDNMERRLARINSSAAGGTAGAGAKTHKVTLPSRWLRAMGITDEEREVELTFDQNRIVITKVVTIEYLKAAKTKRTESFLTMAMPKTIPRTILT